MIIEKTKLQSLIDQWKKFKSIEDDAKAARRMVETAITEFLKVNTREAGATKAQGTEDKATITIKEDVKVNDKLVQEISDENEIGIGILENLFRWKAELNRKNWKAAHSDIKKTFAPAITTKLSNPSVKIESLEDD